MVKKIGDPTIREWQNTIESAPEGAQEFAIFESEDRLLSKKIQFDPKTRLFRFLSIHPDDAVNNYNSGWLDRNTSIDTFQRVLSREDYSRVLAFIHEKEPYVE